MTDFIHILLLVPKKKFNPRNEFAAVLYFLLWDAHAFVIL